MKRVAFVISSLLLVIISVSGCVYHHPHRDYDYGYRRGYHVPPPPPRRVIVRPVPPPPPRIVYKQPRYERRHAHPERRSNRHYRKNSRYSYHERR